MNKKLKIQFWKAEHAMAIQVLTLRIGECSQRRALWQGLDIKYKSKFGYFVLRLQYRARPKPPDDFKQHNRRIF